MGPYMYAAGGEGVCVVGRGSELCRLIGGLGILN